MKTLVSCLLLSLSTTPNSKDCCPPPTPLARKQQGLSSASTITNNCIHPCCSRSALHLQTDACRFDHSWSIQVHFWNSVPDCLFSHHFDRWPWSVVNVTFLSKIWSGSKLNWKSETNIFLARDSRKWFGPNDHSGPLLPLCCCWQQPQPEVNVVFTLSWRRPHFQGTILGQIWEMSVETCGSSRLVSFPCNIKYLLVCEYSWLKSLGVVQLQ